MVSSSATLRSATWTPMSSPSTRWRSAVIARCNLVLTSARFRPRLRPPLWPPAMAMAQEGGGMDQHHLEPHLLALLEGDQDAPPDPRSLPRRKRR